MPAADNLASLLDAHVRERPGQAALIHRRRGGESVMSFAQLKAAAKRAARFLRDQGLDEGDSLLFLQPMSPALYVYMLACLRLGIIVQFIDPGMGRDYIDRCCDIRAPEAMLGPPKALALSLASRALRRIPVKLSSGGWLPGCRPLKRSDACRELETIVDGGDRTALLTFTSGSTGHPKPAARSHHFLSAQNRVLAETLRLTPGETHLTSLPIFALANLAHGVTTIIPPGDLRNPARLDGRAVIDQIGRHAPEKISAPPAFLEAVARASASTPVRQVARQQIFTGGAPVFPQFLQRLESFAPQATVTAIYGSTEAEPIAHLPSRDISDADYEAMQRGAGLLAGKPIDEISIRIVEFDDDRPPASMTDEQFAGVEKPCGAPGEIVVTGEHVLKAYMHGLGDRETKFRVNGTVWHRTGDAGYLDSDNRLWLLGRYAQRIEAAGRTIFPFSVECAAMQAEGVLMASLVEWQKQRLLVIQTDGPLREATRQSLIAKLPVHRLEVIDRMPVDKRHNSKIDYPALMRWLQAKRSTK